MRGATFALLAAVAAAHEAALPLGPLGVPGFPDCAAPEAGFTSGNVSVRAQQIVCAAKPKARADQISVACVGDSITAGVCSSSGDNSYPGQLQGMLGDGYVVTNFGACGSTMQQTGDSPYWKRPQWPAVQASNADVIVIMLGTNDAKTKETGGPANWENDGNTGGDRFAADSKAMIDVFKGFASNPTIYMAVPPPLYKHVYGMNQTVINEVLPGLVRQINADNALPHDVIDVFKALGGASLPSPELFCDGCHPVDAGYTILARAVADVLNPSQVSV